MKKKITKNLLVLSFLLFSLAGHSFTETYVSFKSFPDSVCKIITCKENMLMFKILDKSLTKIRGGKEEKNYNFKNCINYE